MHDHSLASRLATGHMAPANRKRKISIHLLTHHPYKTSSMFHLIYLLTCVITFTIAQNDVLPQQNQHNNILAFTVRENRDNGTLIGNIKSADGQVPYIILPTRQTTDALLKTVFNINFQNGDLTTNTALDREQQERYDFIAVVSQPFAEIKCSVTVLDANDQAPMFLLKSNETDVVIDLPEGVSGARSRLPVAVDYDTPENGIKEFRIISGNTPSGTFRLVEHDTDQTSSLPLQNGNLGDITDDTASTLPGAENPQLLQQLSAQVLIPSQSSPISGASNQQQLLSHSTSRISGTSALNLPMDPRVRYYNIDLEVSQPLDRENQSSYQLVIEAIDGGQPPLIGRLSVTVNVQDRNDNDPEFRSKLYECRIKEDAPRRSLVVRVHAYDPDLDSNGQVSYYIKRHLQSNSSDFSVLSNTGNSKQRSQQSQMAVATSNKPSSYTTKLRSGYNPEQLFEIDPIKGEIYLAEQLDFESDQYHELLIEARDHGKPSRSSFTTVKVYVDDVPDELPSNPRAIEVSSSEVKPESPAPSPQVIEQIPSLSSIIGNINLANMSHPTLFIMIFGVLVAVGSLTCFIKIKSSQPDSDYNPDADTAILASNNVQSKPSPNHSSSNLEQSNVMMGDSLHRHRAIAHPMNSHTAQSRHHPLEHHPYMFDNQNHYTPSSLTYGPSHNHSRAALLQHAHHHQSSHQLSSVHHMMNGLSKCGTMNSIGTHHSAHPQFGSPMPATPNTIHSSGLPSNMHDGLHHSHHNPLLPTVPQSHQVCQLPPTPSHNVNQGSVFTWPPPQGHDSGSVCYPGPNGTLHETAGSTNESCSSQAGHTPPQPLDRWFDLGPAPQLVNSDDWCGSYNWDYLEDWTPDYHLLSIP